MTLAAALLVAAVIGGGGLLQWFWAGWSVYSGAGPSVATRWLLTGAVGAALLLPPGAAMLGAAMGRRLEASGWRDQVRATPWGTARLCWWAGRAVLAPPLLALFLSAAGWTAVWLAGGRETGLPGPLKIVCAHGLVTVIMAAFGAWGLALAVRNGGGGRYRLIPSAGSLLPRFATQSGLWGPVTLLVLAAGPALVGPLLPHLARPERALDLTLLVNPVTAVGAVLGMDVLRSPRVYDLTRAPEYWYTYPPASAVAAIYLTTALLGGCCLRGRLEEE